MNVRESVGLSLDALRANKLRSFLTLLGVIIGVSSVITVMSLVQGLDRYVTGRLSSAGADVFWIDEPRGVVCVRGVSSAEALTKVLLDDPARALSRRLAAAPAAAR